MHESGNFSSPVFTQENNLFGLKMPSVRSKKYIERASTRIESDGNIPFAHYSSPEMCVKDLLLGWHVNFKTNWAAIVSPAAYGHYLKTKGYYTANETLYTSILVSNFAKLDWLKGTATGTEKYIVPVLIAAVVLYIIS